MASLARRMMLEGGSIVQYQMVNGRWVLCTYFTERMKELAEQAENPSLLQLPDELFSPGSGWQALLEEDPNYSGLAFYPYMEAREESEYLVVPFQSHEGKYEALRMVIPAGLMSSEIGDWLMTFRDEATGEGARVTAEAFPGSFHILVEDLSISLMTSFMEEVLEVGIDMLVLPVDNTQWRRTAVTAVAVQQV